jgi:Siphovirus ReqiPepy6 Gp37-like protein
MELHVLDGHTQVERIDAFTRVEVVERDLAAGGWLLELPMDEAGGVATSLATATWPGLEVSDSSWRFGGFLTGVSVHRDEDGVETAQFRGRDFQADLAYRLEYPEASTENEWWANTYAGSIPRTSDAWNMVGGHAGDWAIPRRRIPGLILGDDPGGGEPLARRVKGDPLLDVIRTLLAGTAWTARLRLIRSPGFGVGAVRFDTFARPVAQMILDAKIGTLGALTHTQESSAATFVIAMGASSGAPDPSERFVSTAETPATGWRNRYREAFANRPSTENTAALSGEAQTVLAEGFEPSSVKVDQIQVDGYGSVIDLGWLVDVRIGASFGASSVRLPVAASTLSYTPTTGWIRTVDVGVESLSGPAALSASLARVARQQRQTEGEL